MDKRPTDRAGQAERGSGELNAQHVFDLEEAVRKCFGHYAFFQDMVAGLFNDAEPLLDSMRAALAQGKAAEMAASAHRLKGTLVYLGAERATRAARQVEHIGDSGSLVGAAAALDDLQQQVDALLQALAAHRKTDC